MVFTEPMQGSYHRSHNKLEGREPLVAPLGQPRFASREDEQVQVFSKADTETETVSSEDETIRLDVLLIHEDLAAGLRAKRALEQVLKRLKRKVEFRLHLWKFDLLNEPELHEQALNDARRSSIIVLAVHACAELPVVVRSWLKQWTQTHLNFPRALVVSLDANTTTRSSFNAVLHYARVMAGSAGADLFPHYSETPQVAWDWTSHNTTPATSDWDERGQRFQPPEPHNAWGINE